ncbi:MAG: T9SS type A sorting domain-containing protein [Saprospiraceae bacterium]
MKKPLLLALASIVYISILFFSFEVERVYNGPIVTPGGGEEGGEEREAFEMRQLTDPSTGKIPDGIRHAEMEFARNMPIANSVGFRGAGKWNSRGPWNFGGRTRAMAIDVKNDKHILAGSVSGALFISDDDGQSWRAAKGIGNNLGVVSLAQDTRAGKTDTWYALTGELSGASQSGGGAYFLGDGMFKSVDNGESWTPVASTSSGLPNALSQYYQAGWRTITDPVSTQDVVMMATYGAIYRSANGGSTWTQVRGRNTSPVSYYTDIAVTSTGVYYATLSSAGPDKGIWRSTNGINWTKIIAPDFPPYYDRIVIGINPNNENEVYFLANTDNYGHSTKFISSIDWSSLWRYNYITGDGAGANGTWTNLTGNLPNTGTEFDRFSCQGGYDLVVKVQPQTNNVFIGGSSLYRSTDGFTTPNNTTKIGGYKVGTTLPYFEIYLNHHPDQHDILFASADNKKMYSAGDGGMHVTYDCNAPTVSWTSLNNGYLTTQLYALTIEHSIPKDPIIIGGFQDNGNFFTGKHDAKNPWVQTINGDGAYGAITKGKMAYYLSIQQGKMAKCEIDAEGNVKKYNRIDPIGGIGYQFINQFLLDPNDENTMYVAGGKRLWRNNMLDKIQYENKWDSIALGWHAFPDTIVGKGTITAIAVAKSTPNRVYFGSTNGRIYRVDNAHMDTSRYREIKITGVNGDRFVNCITVDPDNADNVIVTYSNYSVYSIYQTLDGGNTWRKVAGNLELNTGGSGSAPSIRWISILKYPNGAKKYFAATSIGLYSADSLVEHTSTKGTVWSQEGVDAIGNVVCTYIDTRTVDGYVALATHGAGIFSANFDAPDISKARDQQDELELRIYPNPASEVLNWNTELSLTQKATIQIFNSEGRLVRKLAAINRQIQIQDLNSGIYYFTLSDMNRQIVKKFIVR